MKTYMEIDKETLDNIYGDLLGHGDRRFGYLMLQDGYGDFFLGAKYYLVIDEDTI